MKFEIDLFQGQLKLKLQSTDKYEHFEGEFLRVLSKHAPSL